MDSIEILVSAVAAWFVAGVFADAKVDVFVFLGREYVGNKGSAFVLAVTERLPFRKTTGAKGVFLSGFECDFDGSLAGNRWFIRHDRSFTR